MWKHALQAWAFLALPGVALAAPPPTLATATIVEGEATLLRDGSTHALAEGVPMRTGDILHTGAAGRFVRLEFADGLLLDLAPHSRVLLGASPDPATPHGYLLTGTAKLSLPSGARAPAEPVLQSPALTMASLNGGVVISATAAATAVFAESGSALLVPRRGDTDPTPLTLGSGQFYLHAADAKPALAPRPGASFIQGLPRPFRDTLPPRLATLKSRDVVPRRLADITYADAQPWIDAEPALRPQFVARWRGLARRPDFRAALIEHLPAHPEWERVLEPLARPHRVASSAR